MLGRLTVVLQLPWFLIDRIQTRKRTEFSRLISPSLQLDVRQKTAMNQSIGIEERGLESFVLTY